MNHRHKASKSSLRPFSGCVDAHRCEQSAHGGACYRETCECGAVRNMNLNGAYREFGRWMRATEVEAVAR